MSSGSQGSTLLSLISACTRFPIHLAVIAGGCPLSLSHKLSAQYISFQNLGRKWIHPGAQTMFSRGVIISMLIVILDILIFSYFTFWWVSSRLYFVVIYIISHVGYSIRIRNGCTRAHFVTLRYGKFLENYKHSIGFVEYKTLTTNYTLNIALRCHWWVLQSLW